MGKIARLGSRKKAKRWPKGQSSNSNPETTKHREKATWMFFKDFAGTPGITTEDLQKHDAMQSILPRLKNVEIGDDDDDGQSESVIDGTIDSVKSFASTYSNCTHMSFRGFLEHFQPKSLIQKEMLAVISAVTEVIKQNGGTGTTTEYFGALMSTLEAVDTDISVAATLSLLGMEFKSVPINVLNAQFSAVSKVFLQILTKYIEVEHFLIIRHCIGCISLLLRFQEAAVWSNSSTTQILDAVLTFTIHSKPKIRKAAQYGICSLLKASYIMTREDAPTYHPAAPHVAKHCINQLNAACEPGGITSVLHILVLLKDIIHVLPKSYVKTICEELLRIMGLNNVLITSCCLQVLHGLFVSKPSETILPSQRNAQIITALYDYQPPATDAQPTLAWLTVMQEAHCNLIEKCPDTCAAIMPRIFGKCIELWFSDKQEVVSGTFHTVKVLLHDCISHLCKDEETGKKYKTILDQIICMMHEPAKNQHLDTNKPFDCILYSIELLFQITGKTKNPHLIDILKTLGKLCDLNNFTYTSAAENAIGAAIKTLGPRIVLKTLPVQTTEGSLNLERCWLFPLLKDSITCGSISFFTEILLPLAVFCNNKSKEPGGKNYELLVTQIWAILPSLCNDADDVKTNFKDIAKLLGSIISGVKDLRLSAMSALRKLIVRATENNNTEDISELARFAKNYLPVLFVLYTNKPRGTDEEGHRLAAFETIKIYLKITQQQLICELFDKALDKLKGTEIDDYTKESIYDLIRLLIEFTDVSRIKQFYDMCVPYIRDKTKGKEQKKAYKFLEGLCGSEKEICKTFFKEHRQEIQKLMISSATTLVQTSKGARIRCLIHLVKIHPKLEKSKFLQAIIPEAILCVKDINQRCRTSAYQLIHAIADVFLQKSSNLEEYMKMLIIGLAGEPKCCSCTLLVLASMIYHYNDSIEKETSEEMLQHACSLAISPTREIAESALSYIKVFISITSNDLIAKQLQKIVKTLTDMNDNCKRHFRQKVRDIFTKLIRKFSIKVISPMIPTSDVILHKRLKNINKVEQLKKKNKELKKMKKSEKDDDNEFSAKKRPKSMEDLLADSEEEYGDSEDEEPKKNNKKRTSRKEAWIKENAENIVDLIDPTTARNITTTKPGTNSNMNVVPIKKPKEPKDYGFKIAPDGRFIIKDDNQKDDDEDNEMENKKRKYMLSENDSNDDYEDDEEDKKSLASVDPASRKRKHGASSDTTSMKSFGSSKYRAGGSGIHRPLKVRKVEQTTPGSEYRAHKAGGDIKKKGKPDPYAYVPLTRAALNKRKKKKMATKLRGIVAGAKKGAQFGTKNKRNRK
ncbi:PREDICTED: RRP12-like protein [Polistes dominula]|uniref:RRP12-like protein n=1 Tax=Polistes dominula TaxID=743375 RepID=A0ABM1J8Q3_POLDO|nr:PREDICTED: RRP12-like protein [Polistes dominula]